MNDKECLMIEEQKSFIYMMLILLLMDADFNIVQAGPKQQAPMQCSECDGQAAGQMNI